MSSFSNDESLVANKLLEEYNIWNPTRSIRPLANSSGVMDVKFGVGLMKLIEYDEERSIATLSLITHQVCSIYHTLDKQSDKQIMNNFIRVNQS